MWHVVLEDMFIYTILRSHLDPLLPPKTLEKYADVWHGNAYSIVDPLWWELIAGFASQRADGAGLWCLICW